MRPIQPLEVKKMAEKERFELSRRLSTSTRFPGVRLKPLGHLSVPKQYYIKLFKKTERCCVDALIHDSTHLSLQMHYYTNYSRKRRGVVSMRLSMIRPTSRFSIFI